MAHFTILSQEQIDEALNKLPKWEQDNNQLTATYTFKDFRTAFAFITLVAEEAERAGHHPEWTNIYNKVTFKLSTHDAGDKVTDLDIHMAGYINENAKQFLES
jgi:4a-hydroxytetrahydrobiopterin dehydratase